LQHFPLYEKITLMFETTALTAKTPTSPQQSTHQETAPTPNNARETWSAFLGKSGTAWRKEFPHLHKCDSATLRALLEHICHGVQQTTAPDRVSLKQIQHVVGSEKFTVCEQRREGFILSSSRQENSPLTIKAYSPLNSQQSTVNSQQSTVNSQQSTVNSQQSTVIINIL
jgi:hypothetical protein